MRRGDRRTTLNAVPVSPGNPFPASGRHSFGEIPRIPLVLAAKSFNTDNCRAASPGVSSCLVAVRNEDRLVTTGAAGEVSQSQPLRGVRRSACSRSPDRNRAGVSPKAGSTFTSLGLMFDGKSGGESKEISSERGFEWPDLRQS